MDMDFIDSRQAMKALLGICIGACPGHGLLRYKVSYCLGHNQFGLPGLMLGMKCGPLSTNNMHDLIFRT